MNLMVGPGENWLDIRSDNVSLIMKKRIDLAVQKGCDGVEPDNMDGYSNHSGFSLTFEEQLKLQSYDCKLSPFERSLGRFKECSRTG
jgi:hypothetical protein